MSDTVEIPKGELDVLRRAYGLMDKLWNSPQRGMDVKKFAKEVDPSIKVPDLDIVSAVSGPLEEKLTAVSDSHTKLTERLDKFERSLKDKEDEGKLGNAFDKVRKDYGLTEDGVNGVVTLMRDRQIADPEAAAALFMRQQPAAPKPISGPNYMPASLDIMGGFGPEKEMAEWLADPGKKADRIAAEILNDVAA